MAAIGPSAKALSRKTFCGLLLLVGLAAGKPPASESSEARAQVNYVASALTAGNWSDAMTPFSATYSNRDKLRNYFTGLTNSFNVSSEVDFLDEQDTAAECKLTVRWALTLTDLGNNNSEHRAADLTVRLAPEKGKWKIVDLTPIALFDPSGGSSPKQ